MNKKEKITKKEMQTLGESAACAYLKGKGHVILARNLTLKKGEIDILTLKRGTLHIVEIKTSELTADEESLAEPDKGPSVSKMRRLKALSRELLSEYPANPVFDMLERDEKSDRGHILRDEPAVQVDRAVVRLKFDAGVISKVKVRYYPAL